MVFRSMVAGTLLLGAMSGTLAQSGNLNLLTDLDSPFPHGCLSAELPEEAPVINRLLIGAEGDILAPTIQSTSRDGLLRIRSWRVACPDESHSVVLVRLTQIFGANPIVIPQVFVGAGDVEIPTHQARLLLKNLWGQVLFLAPGRPAQCRKQDLTPV